MEFYTLLNKKSQKQIADVIEFEDGQVVVKWIGKVNSIVIYQSLDEFKEVSLRPSRLLIHEGVEDLPELIFEDDETSQDDKSLLSDEKLQLIQDILYSA